VWPARRLEWPGLVPALVMARDGATPAHLNLVPVRRSGSLVRPGKGCLDHSRPTIAGAAGRRVEFEENRSPPAEHDHGEHERDDDPGNLQAHVGVGGRGLFALAPAAALAPEQKPDECSEPGHGHPRAGAKDRHEPAAPLIAEYLNGQPWSRRTPSWPGIAGSWPRSGPVRPKLVATPRQ
jgi:hypothetical protein